MTDTTNSPSITKAFFKSIARTSQILFLLVLAILPAVVYLICGIVLINEQDMNPAVEFFFVITTYVTSMRVNVWYAETLVGKAIVNKLRHVRR